MHFKTTDAEPGTRIRHPSNGYQWRNKHNVHHNVTALVTKHSMNNHLTQKERNTVRRLRNNASTKSLPADKWKAMVDYLQRVATHFSMMINPACEYLQIFSQKQPTKESLADSEKKLHSTDLKQLRPRHAAMTRFKDYRKNTSQSFHSDQSLFYEDHLRLEWQKRSPQSSNS